MMKGRGSSSTWSRGWGPLKQLRLGVAKMTMYRMLRGEAPIDDSRLEKILSAIPSEEVLEILGARKRLEACGAVEGGGSMLW